MLVEKKSVAACSAVNSVGFQDIYFLSILMNMPLLGVGILEYPTTPGSISIFPFGYSLFSIPYSAMTDNICVFHSDSAMCLRSVRF